MWRFHARRRRRNTGRFSVRRLRLPPQLPPPGDGCSKNLRRRYYSFIRLRSHRHNKPVATSTMTTVEMSGDEILQKKREKSWEGEGARASGFLLIFILEFLMLIYCFVLLVP
ncbi:unnamed protein product [Linum tenue]|uniref:Uncharacterized protein n=1 Tax=Linum tenue TaxID=586396 RepID=A0AAV0GZ32_9ROSI|nr:unnamed protein product [Linum tenue]